MRNSDAAPPSPQLNSNMRILRVIEKIENEITSKDFEVYDISYFLRMKLADNAFQVCDCSLKASAVLAAKLDEGSLDEENKIKVRLEDGNVKATHLDQKLI